MNHKIILFGKNGMLGNYILKYFKNIPGFEIIGFDRNDIDIKNITFSQLSDFLNKYLEPNKDITIINAIGLILPVKNTNINDNLTINSVFPHLLSIYSKFNNLHFIQPSTDCVFNGINNGNYKETDEPNETNIYGKSKFFGEPQYGSTIRVSIIGEEINHKYSLIEWVKSNKGKTINGFTNNYWNGITCLEYCHIFEQIITKKLFWNGVRHLYSNTLSKFELVSLINKVFNLNITIVPTDTKTCINKTLSSIHNLSPLTIKSLQEQLIELATTSKQYV